MSTNYFGSLTTALVKIGVEVARVRAASKLGNATEEEVRRVEAEEASLRRLWDQSFFGRKEGTDA